MHWPVVAQVVFSMMKISYTMMNSLLTRQILKQKEANSIANPMNSIAKRINPVANRMNSIVKATNSIAKTSYMYVYSNVNFSKF